MARIFYRGQMTCRARGHASASFGFVAFRHLSKEPAEIPLRRPSAANAAKSTVNILDPYSFGACKKLPVKEKAYYGPAGNRLCTHGTVVTR